MIKHTKESILRLLETNDRAVERAMVAILKRQTEDERVTEETRHANGRGFMGCHARKGTYYGEWVLKGNRLTGHHLDNARKMSYRYAGQLARIANGED